MYWPWSCLAELILITCAFRLFPWVFLISANTAMCDIICPPNTSNITYNHVTLYFFPAASNNALTPLAFVA